jgi:hypothetical protein
MQRKYYYEYKKSKSYMIKFFILIILITFSDLAIDIAFGNYGQHRSLAHKMCDCLDDSSIYVQIKSLIKFMISKSEIGNVFILYSIIKYKRTDDIL